ncbi:MAG: dienelactone hydrolase family protein [Endozoicomonas sp.]
MKKLIKILAGLTLFLVVGATAFWYGGGMTLAARLMAPSFPDLPAPVSQLDEGQKGLIYFPSNTPFDLDVMLAKGTDSAASTGMGTLFLPENIQPGEQVPAVVLVHGSGGISPGREMEYGELLAENGYAAFVVDYYRPRGGEEGVSYMRLVLSVTEFDAIADAYNALKVLRTHPQINPDKIAVAGYSYGGMAARFAMDERIREAMMDSDPGFAVNVDYYGPCFQNLQSSATTGAPILTLRGTEDNSNELSACTKREEELKQLGSEVETYVFDGVGHSWDINLPLTMTTTPYVAGCEVLYEENGHSKLNGQYIVDFPVEASRYERIANRILSANIFGDCVGEGYLVGSDPETKAKTDALLLAFLNKNLKG